MIHTKYLTEELQYLKNAAAYTVLSGARQRRKVLVNGCPKSGTTWMLRLLTSLPGYRAAGNFLGDIDRYGEVRPGDVVHGHDSYSERLWEILHRQGIAVILLVRDPRDQVVSRYHHARRDRLHPFHNEILELTLEDGLMASIEGGQRIRGVGSSIRFSEKWIREARDLHIVHYEELSANPVHEFRATVDYLEIALSTGLIESIVTRNRFERLSVGRKLWLQGRLPGHEDPQSHFRKGVVGDWMNCFNEDHLARFNELSGERLARLGYEPVSTL